jgi:secretion/DNA translocation related TadE-like protein
MNGCVKHAVKQDLKCCAKCSVERSAKQPARRSNERCGKRFVKWLARHDDEGSGTISGVALIAVAAIMLATVASAGNLLLCLHRVQNMADLASVAAAQALYDGDADPCAAAERTLSGNEVALESCSLEDEDVIVTAVISTSVPLVPEVSRRSRAGPIACN